MKKKIIALMLAGILMTGLVACGNADQSKPSETGSEEKAEAQSEETETEETSAETEEEEAQEAGTDAGPEVINVCMLMEPESVMIWKSLEDPLKEEGINLNLSFHDDPQTMESLIAAGGSFYYFDLVVSSTDIEGYSPIAYTTVSPLDLYSTKYSSAEEVVAAKANVGVPALSMPNGVTLHSLKVLSALGLITVKDESSTNLLEAEREENVHMRGYGDNFPNQEAQEEFDTFLAFRYNEDYEPIVTDPCMNDESEWEKIYCPTEYTKDPAKLDAFEKVIKAYQSEAVKEQMKETKFVPVGWDQDLISQYK